MNITNHGNIYSLFLAIYVIYTRCANIYIRKLRRKTHWELFLWSIYSSTLKYDLKFFKNFNRLRVCPKMPITSLSPPLFFYSNSLSLFPSFSISDRIEIEIEILLLTECHREDCMDRLKLNHARSRFSKFPQIVSWNFETRVTLNRIDTIVHRWLTKSSYIYIIL